MSMHVAERVLPEHLIGVPERESVTHYRGDLGQLAVALTQTEGIVPYLYDEGIVHRDVLLGDEVIGDYGLRYDYENRKIKVDGIFIQKHLGEGIGKALYLSALDLPLPSGEQPRPEGFYLESNGQSVMARRVWEGFVRKGIAERGPKGLKHYLMK